MDFLLPLRMGVDAMRLLDVRAYRAQRATKIFLLHDERILRELAQHYADNKSYSMSRAKPVVDSGRRRTTRGHEALRAYLKSRTPGYFPLRGCF